MGIPAHWNSTFRYKEALAVVDVQTIINDLYTELVTNGGWTCPVGGVGETPTEFKSPTRSDGVFITLNCSRISATRMAYMAKDHMGLLINNQTDTRQDIDGTGTTVHYYTGEFHVCVNTERTTPECWAVGMLDQTPDSFSSVLAMYWCTRGPRLNAGTWDSNSWVSTFARERGATSYTGVTRGNLIGYYTTHRRQHGNGTWLIEPWEMTGYNPDYDVLLGRVFQAILVSDQFAWAAEITVPLGDGASTGVFKVVGIPLGYQGKIAFRKG